MSKCAFVYVSKMALVLNKSGLPADTQLQISAARPMCVNSLYQQATLVHQRQCPKPGQCVAKTESTHDKRTQKLSLLIDFIFEFLNTLHTSPTGETNWADDLPPPCSEEVSQPASRPRAGRTSHQWNTTCPKDKERLAELVPPVCAELKLLCWN